MSPRFKQAFLPLLLLVALVLTIAYRPVWQPLLERLYQSPGALGNLSKKPIDSLKSTNQRTNILLLGMGGAEQAAGDLTDSMILVSYHHPTQNTVLISIPRDLWVESMKAKINTAYYYGEQNQPGGGGLILAKSAVDEILGLPVHYAFAIDFSGFRQAIDLVGGVEVEVERTFDDYRYPIPGMEDAQPEALRYEHLHFDAGPRQMDGETALKFVRSRMADGIEGTDFARSARQQKVILAFKNKLLSVQTLLNPARLSELMELYGQYTSTDISDEEYGAFARLALEVKPEQVFSISLATDDEDTGQIGILQVGERSRYQGQYVLVPKDENWEALKQYIANRLDD
jgi:LCP family protein required for cell wall assembly